MSVDNKHVTLPTQAKPPEDTAAAACKALWFEVLHVAALDFKAGRSSAKFFFESNSFKTLCSLLDLDIDAIQEALEMQPAQSAKQRKPRKKTIYNREYQRAYRERKAAERAAAGHISAVVTPEPEQTPLPIPTQPESLVAPVFSWQSSL